MLLTLTLTFIYIKYQFLRITDKFILSFQFHLVASYELVLWVLIHYKYDFKLFNPFDSINLMFLFLFSSSQSIIYHIERHPNFPTFEQCVTFNFFSTLWKDTLYNLFCVTVLYLVPLLIIICCYVRISWEIYQRSRNTGDGKSKSNLFFLSIFYFNSLNDD